jgi:hypothetical protein
VTKETRLTLAACAGAALTAAVAAAAAGPWAALIAGVGACLTAIPAAAKAPPKWLGGKVDARGQAIDDEDPKH